MYPDRDTCDLFTARAFDLADSLLRDLQGLRRGLLRSLDMVEPTQRAFWVATFTDSIRHHERALAKVHRILSGHGSSPTILGRLSAEERMGLYRRAAEVEEGCGRNGVEDDVWMATSLEHAS